MINFSKYDIELGIEELNEYRPSPSLKTHVSIDDINISHGVKPLVCYALADMGVTDYHFKQPFEQSESVEYFEAMQTITSHTINDLTNTTNRGSLSHFYRTPLQGNLLRLIERLSPKGHDKDMFVYHFALHTDKAGANRNKGTRSPRIYFMVGEKGIIYPLFFDPYHEINPM